MAFPPPGARPATVVGPGNVEPDIRMAFDELPPEVPVPTNAVDMMNLAHRLAIDDLLNGVISGNVVVRLVGRAFEVFVLGANQPADIHDMIRYLANNRKPQADAIALVQLAIMPSHNPPVPGIYARAECGGEHVETFVTLAFPEGPAGRKVLDKWSWRAPKPLPEDGVWLGVDPIVFFDLGPLGQEQARTRIRSYTDRMPEPLIHRCLVCVVLCACSGETRDDITTPADPCDGLECVDVCGVPFAKGDAPAVVGWTVRDLPSPGARDVARVGDLLFSVDSTSVRLYDATLSPLGLLGPLDVPVAIAPAGSGVVVQVSRGPFIVVSGDDPSAPTALAAWHPLELREDGETNSTRMYGTWRGKALVGIRPFDSVIAVIDFSDPDAPSVEACLRDPEFPYIYDVRASDDVVAVGVSDGGYANNVALYAPDDAETPYAHLPSSGDLVFAMDRSRLAVWQEDGVGLFDISVETPVEIGRRTGDHLRATWFHPPIAGGIVVHGGGYGDVLWGLDLRDDALPLVSVDFGDGYACALGVSDEGGERLFDVVPAWFPDDRFDIDAAPACPASGPEPIAIQAGGVSPDGTAVLVKEDQGPWRAFRPLDGSYSSTPIPDDAWGALWLDGAYVYGATWGYNQTELHVLSDDGTRDVPHQLPGPGRSIAADGDRAWIIGEPVAFDNEDEGFVPPDPSDRLAWTLLADGTLTPCALPAGSKPYALLPAGDAIALVDQDGNHRLLSREGAVISDLSGEPLADPGGVAASGDTVFTTTVDRRILASRAGVPPVEIAPARADVRLAAAEGGLVRWNRLSRPAPGFAAYYVTELVDPDTLAVVASLPAPTSARVLGSPGALVGRGIFVVDDPQ